MPYWFKLAFAFSLLATVSWAALDGVAFVPGGNRRAVGGESGEDFTANSGCLGAWIIDDNDDSGGPDEQLNECDVGTNSEFNLSSNGPVYTTREGMEFLDFDSGNPDNATMTDAEAVDLGTPTTEATLGGFFRADGSQSDKGMLNMGSGQLQIKQHFSGSPAVPRCEHPSGSPHDSASTTLADATIVHVVCRWNGGDDALEVFVDGVEEGTEATNADALTTDTDEACMADVLSGATCLDTIAHWNGEISNAGYFDFEMSDCQICEWCRFGLDGNATDRDASCNTCDVC